MFKDIKKSGEEFYNDANAAMHTYCNAIGQFYGILRGHDVHVTKESRFSDLNDGDLDAKKAKAEKILNIIVSIGTVLALASLALTIASIVPGTLPILGTVGLACWGGSMLLMLIGGIYVHKMRELREEIDRRKSTIKADPFSVPAKA